MTVDGYYERVKDTPLYQTRRRQHERKQLHRLRLLLISKLGGVCAVCKTPEEATLEADHVNGGGSAQRSEYRSRKQYYRAILAGRIDAGTLQLLCANDHARITKARRVLSATKSARFSRKRRQEALMLLGNVCVDCGEDDQVVLEIDHINGGGRQDPHYKKIEKSIVSGSRTTTDLQVVCANCHANRTRSRVQQEIATNG